MDRAKKIVLTGGPCAGKTTVADFVGRAFAGRAAVVPESASLLLRGGFPRWGTDEGRRAMQTAIFQVQRQIERAYSTHYSAPIQILDRGSLDGAAYWPDGPEGFFEAMQTTQSAEFERYDHVIYLQSPSREQYALYCSKNPTRTETWEAATRLDEITQGLWAGHPRFHCIRYHRFFVDKVAAVVDVLTRPALFGA